MSWLPDHRFPPAFQSRETVAVDHPRVAEDRSPVTVAGQPRIRTGVPCAARGTYQSAARPTTVAPVACGAMPAAARVLVLGGSTEASAVARRLAARGADVTTSFAGRTRERVQPPGSVRVGGFGGIDGLARYLRSERIDLLVDATHPFAAQMPHHAAAACAQTGVPGVRVLRPPWRATDGDEWHPVHDLDEAARSLEARGAKRVFLTTGRQTLRPFARLHDVWFLVRAIEAPEHDVPPNAQVVLGRGPFDEDDEHALMVEHAIDTVVAKNSGGDATVAKLRAARRLGLPVVMVERPAQPPVTVVESVDEAMAWVDAQLQSADGYVRGV